MPLASRTAAAIGPWTPTTTFRVAPTLLAWLPVAAMAVYLVLLVTPATGDFAVGLVQENGPVETLTLLAFLAGGIQALRLAGGLRRRGDERLAALHYTLFGAGLVFIGMEEVAWGQHLLGFETPEAMRQVNHQGEVTLHNIGPMQGRSELFRLAFGVAGCIGLALARVPALRALAVPAVLAPLLALITVAAALDSYNDFYPLSLGMTAEQWRWASEKVELLIGVAGLLYVHLNLQLLRGRAPAVELGGGTR